MAAKHLQAAALLLTSLALCSAQNVTLLNLLSRPDIKAPTVYVQTHNAALTAPGYIFMSPSSPGNTNFQIGAYIYNNLGHLVWSGASLMDPAEAAFDAQVCNYEGTPHLCFTQFAGPVGGGTGIGSFSQILDDTYTTVQTLRPMGTYAGQELTQDLHEFNVVGATGATALVTSYVTFAHNVTYPACPGSPTTPYTKNGLLSEISTDGKNTTIFQWSAIDHVDPTDTYVCPGDINVGGGTSMTDGFDFFHINALDKDSDGDYLISSRHCSTLFKVAGLTNPQGLTPGTIIWRLGGKQSSFPTMASTVAGAPNLNFSFQHHARFQQSIGGVSLWDNSNSNIVPASANASSGMTVAINANSTDNSTWSATLIEQYISPGRQLDSSQGSHQFLPNGNHFLGMGSVPDIYEQTESGETVFYANFGPEPLQSYRAFKFPWTAKPLPSELALFAYAQNCSAPAAFYASWNGATSVTSYKFFTSSSKSGTFALAATGANNGTFETFATGAFNLYAYAIAYDDLGNNLGQTPTVATFVPGAALAADCGPISCAPGTSYSSSEAAICGAPNTTSTSSTTSSTSTTISSTTNSSTTTTPSTTSVAPTSTPSVSSSSPVTVASAPIASTTVPIKPVVSSKPHPSSSKSKARPASTSVPVRPVVSRKPTHTKTKAKPLSTKSTQSTSVPVKPAVSSKPTPSLTKAKLVSVTPTPTPTPSSPQKPLVPAASPSSSPTKQNTRTYTTPIKAVRTPKPSHTTLHKTHKPKSSTTA